VVLVVDLVAAAAVAEALKYAGGQHWIYVFKNSQYEEGTENRMPAYDEGAYLYENLEVSGSTTNVRRVFRACTWVGSSLLNEGFEMLSIEDGLIPNDARIRLRVAKAYEKYSPTNVDPKTTMTEQQLLESTLHVLHEGHGSGADARHRLDVCPR
jgi:hypothetical protein